MPFERRRALRTRVLLAGDLLGRHGRELALSVDGSVDGLRLVTNRSMVLGDPVHLAIATLDRRPLALSGVAVRVTPTYRNRWAYEVALALDPPAHGWIALIERFAVQQRRLGLLAVRTDAT